MLESEETFPMNTSDISDGCTNTIVHINPSLPEIPYNEQSRTIAAECQVRSLKKKLTVEFSIICGIVIFFQLTAVFINSVKENKNLSTTLLSLNSSLHKIGIQENIYVYQ